MNDEGNLISHWNRSRLRNTTWESAIVCVLLNGVSKWKQVQHRTTGYQQNTGRTTGAREKSLNFPWICGGWTKGAVPRRVAWVCWCCFPHFPRLKVGGVCVMFHVFSIFVLFYWVAVLVIRKYPFRLRRSSAGKFLIILANGEWKRDTLHQHPPDIIMVILYRRESKEIP